MPPADQPCRTILHVDMDAFFASVEQLDNPTLRGRPVIVGAPPDQRGVVSTCSYEARRFGVHSAMPSRTAFKLCPQGVFLPPRGARYQEVAEHLRRIFGAFTPQVEPVSIDEAFLDVTGSNHLFGGDVATARALKDRIRAETGLTASVGVAPNKFLAKLASDLQKPDGLTVAPREAAAIAAFLAPLPVGRIWGVGEKTEQLLHAQGLRHIGDLQALPESALARIVGPRSAAALKLLAQGVDERPLELDTEEKSISNEHTFPTDEADWSVVEHTLIALAAKVGRRLRQAGKFARTAHLKLRWGDFTTITRQQPLTPPAQSDRLLVTAARELLQRERCSRAVRLVGFGVSALLLPGPDGEPPHQPGLFDQEEEPRRERDRRLDSALDRIRDQFGDDSIRRGSAPPAR